MKSREEMVHFCRNTLGLSDSAPLEVFPFEGRGSDRKFFRVTWNGADSAILIHYNPERIENTFYAGIATFLREIHVPAPRIIRHDSPACLLLLEDLGEEDLWSFRNAPWEHRRELYRRTLGILRRLQSFPEEDFPSGRVKLMERFGPDLYRWEREYFRENFVRIFCGMKLEPGFDRELEAELSILAERLSGSGRCLVHRDLQSQNVMVREGEPFLIDFQGMRFGSPFYDLGSLLCDPYVIFSAAERDELLLFYYELSAANGEWPAFQNHFWEAAAQRLMQALGAYAFLGLQKKLEAFLDHIPAGLQNLQLAARRATSLPRLRELSTACAEAMEQNKWGRKGAE
jgi:aminoglycoside/choline kinase family phosphotransferase